MNLCIGSRHGTPKQKIPALRRNTKMKKTVNILNLIALIVLFAGCTLRPVDNTTLGVEIPGETLENLLTPFMYSYPQDGSEYKPYFKLTWEYQGNVGEKTIPVSEITGCQEFLMGEANFISGSPKIFTINDIPVGSNLTANLELFDAHGFALYSSKTVAKSITAKDKSLTLELYSTSPVVYYDFFNYIFYGVADDDETQTFTLINETLNCSTLQPRSFPYIREKIEEENLPRAHCGTMITGINGGGETTREVIPPGRSYASSENEDSIALEVSNHAPQWVAGGTDFSKNKIWAVHENMSEFTERILCYGGKYYTIHADEGAGLAYNVGSSINWAVDDGNLYAVIRLDEQGIINHYFLRGTIEEDTVILSDTGFKFTEPGVPSSWGGNTSANGITDATARDGNLYFLYCQRHNNQTETRGFLYKILNAANMSEKSTTDVLSGWTDDEDHLPVNNYGKPFENKLYNPLRFVAVKPEKLYIADGGFRFNEAYDESAVLSGSDMNRIVVFDLQSESPIYDEAMSLENVSFVGSGSFSSCYPAY